MEKLLAVAAVVAMLLVTLCVSVGVQALSESQRYVHTYLNDAALGNMTYLEKPIFPVHFNESQIPIGQSWNVVCPLREGHSYHVYCYGDWVHTGAAPKTDYDIYVYNPRGALESSTPRRLGCLSILGRRWMTRFSFLRTRATTRS